MIKKTLGLIQKQGISLSVRNYVYIKLRSDGIDFFIDTVKGFGRKTIKDHA